MTADPHSTAHELLAAVCDPELPMISVLDLGIVRRVDTDPADAGRVSVDITPTYSGCPALATIEADIRTALSTAFDDVEVRTVLSPAWTTDWMTEDGKAALAAHGIAPPRPVRALATATATMGTLLELRNDDPPPCPRCGAADATRISEFGSTACKALWRCTSCAEPFDEFKAH